MQDLVLSLLPCEQQCSAAHCNGLMAGGDDGPDLLQLLSEDLPALGGQDGPGMLVLG